MTHAIDAHGVNSDRVDSDRRRWPVALAAIVAGLIVGALVGGLFAASGSPTYAATTALSVLPDPSVDITSQNGSDSNVATQDATSYIQSQLVIINGPTLADRVRREAALDSDPTLVATQVGQTYVVQVSATAGSRGDAVDAARLTGQAYAQLRTRRFVAEIDQLLSSTNQQLKTVQTGLAAARPTGTATLTPSQTALQTEFERLLSVRSSLHGAGAQADKIVTVVSPARVSGDALSTDRRDALGGAIIGAILALLALLVVRRAVPRIRDAGDLAALDVPVLLPTYPRRSFAAMRRGAFAEAGEARLLAARLHAGPLGNQDPLVVVGANPVVGNSVVAASVAASLAARGPVLLVRTGAALGSQPAGPAVDEQIAPTVDDSAVGESTVDNEAADDTVADEPSAEAATAAHARSDADGPSDEGREDVEPARQVLPSTVPGIWLLTVPGTSADATAGGPPGRVLTDLVSDANRAGWLVVVDAEPVSQSDIALDCARNGAALTLVVGRGRTSPAAVLAAVELLEADQTTLLGVILNDVPGPVRRFVGARTVPEVQAAADGAPASVDAPPWTPEQRGAPRPGAARSAARPRPSVNGSRVLSRHAITPTTR